MFDVPAYLGGYRAVWVDKNALACAEFALNHNLTYTYIESLVGEKVEGGNNDKGKEGSEGHVETESKDDAHRGILL